MRRCRCGFALQRSCLQGRNGGTRSERLSLATVIGATPCASYGTPDHSRGFPSLREDATEVLQKTAQQSKYRGVYYF